MQACNVDAIASLEADVPNTSSSGNRYATRTSTSLFQHLQKDQHSRQESTQLLTSKDNNNEWQECSTFVNALLRVETWIHGRILECVWWQVRPPTEMATAITVVIRTVIVSM